MVLHRPVELAPFIRTWLGLDWGTVLLPVQELHQTPLSKAVSLDQD